MKPVLQRRVGEEGTCLSACVASILEVSEDDVGDLLEGWTDDCGVAWFHWANDRLSADRGMALAYTMVPPVGYSIGIGPSIRNPTHEHAVVCLDGEIIHDPSPRGADLQGLVAYMVLIPASVPATKAAA